MSSVTLHTLNQYKLKGEKFAMLTAYDASFAHLVSSAGVEVILVGDSLGMVLQGQSSTVPVTLDDMVYHTQSVARGNQGAMIMSDMPFMGCATLDSAMNNAAALMRAGAQMIKLEGGRWLAPIVTKLTEQGVPVCAHLGLTPQSVNMLGGYKVQGREQGAALQMLEDARVLEEAGAACLLLECVPSLLAEEITENSKVPVIGIGAGPHTDAQVLVLHDMLGITPGKRPKFVKNFMLGAESVTQAVEHYVADVKSGKFPSAEHSFE